MTDAAESLFEQLSTYQALKELIESGETEGLYLECKAPSEPRLTKDLKRTLATAISGFANTAGGLVIFGLSTTKHAHTGLDVITQIEPIGSVGKLEQQIRTTIPTLTIPRVLSVKIRIIRERPHDTRGVVAVYVPTAVRDAVQSTEDNIFYIRTGDDFRAAPYEIIRRLFSAVDSPDLIVRFESRLVKIESDGRWKIPIVISNESPAVAEYVKVTAAISNSEAIDQATSDGFHDQSSVNPGKTIFMTDIQSVIHRGLDQIAGTLLVKMRQSKRPKRALKLEIVVYANKMRAKKVTCSLSLARAGFTVKDLKHSDAY